jgi:hypothetical protein
VPNGATRAVDLDAMYEVLEASAHSIAGGDLSLDMKTRLAAWKRNLRHHQRMLHPAYRGAWSVTRHVRDSLRKIRL